MSYFSAEMVILAALYSSLQLESVATSLTRIVRFNNQQMKVGKNHVSNTKLAYALCEIDPFEKSGRCIVKLESNAFEKSEPVYPCPVEISTRYISGSIDVLGVELWGEDKIIFTWRDQNKNNVFRTKVSIHTLQMQNCESTVHELEADTRADMTTPLFIVTSENSYEVAYMNSDQCEKSLCRLIVNINGEASEPEIWFPDVGMVHAVEKINNHVNKIVISWERMDDDFENVKYSLLHENGIQELGKNHFAEEYGWSSSNGRISFCTTDRCKQFNYNGIPLNTVTLTLENQINTFMGLYNLPQVGHLAVICDNQPGSNYRFIRIGQLGHQQYAKDLNGLKCWQRPDYQTIKFFVNSNAEYCITFFLSFISYYSWAIVRMYCFTPQDILL